jgi:hypothetical protein
VTSLIDGQQRAASAGADRFQWGMKRERAQPACAHECRRLRCADEKWNVRNTTDGVPNGSREKRETSISVPRLRHFGRVIADERRNPGESPAI